MKKQFLQKLGFSPKENSNNVYFKTFKDNYTLEVDFENEKIDYGDKIISGRATTQNFKDEENWVVLECVNRLLEKGYNPSDIELEKKFTVGHGASGGWLDILVKKDGKTFLMIECKTYPKEFEKELANTKKKGGQLLTYFLQDRDAKYLVLYTANIGENYDFEKDYKNEIIVIEDSYREMSNLEDLYERWNKQTKQNGIFESWINAYKFESRALRYNDLIDIKEEDASYIFNRFLEILRHNTVSDKPNAFNKMFTLFLCKIKDEIDNEGEENELEFQWIEGKDNYIDFQKRLTDLYKKGMEEFLSKQVTDFSDEEFNEEFKGLEEDIKKKLLEKITKLRLQKNNEFAIKEVFDDDSFEENAKVLKEIVELLQKYKFRYTKKQPFLGEFFELLLTTGLKQESGQFFTPVPIARFICMSIPLEKVIEEKIKEKNTKDILPNVIDYAAGSGHFLIESMEEIQKIINKKDVLKYNKFIKNKFIIWKTEPYTWAGEYVYGIEKDYRLVRTSKVGCYLHGDGIATVIHGDGLDNFKNSKDYKGKLKKYNPDDESQNEQFDFVLSNPPYSISSFKGNLKQDSKQAEKDFKLYNKLTDQSSEIEALFIERTSQLLKEGGIASIILPSSILSNTGIYTKAREIILKDFEIVSIVELGSNTFMATGTNTVILFLKKRNKFFSKNLENSVNKFFENKQDITLNGIENAVSKYVSEVWEGLNFEDYKSLLEKEPNEKIKNHEIFKDYENKNLNLDLDKILELEKEKLFYFVLTYPQKTILVKSGEKKTEKEFLGYEFSNRRGHEGIHAIQRGRQIDECTKLFDPESYENPEKVNSYIFSALNNNEFNKEISENLKNHLFYTNLVDLLTFDRTTFEKTISLNLKKKIKIKSKWEIVKLGDIIIENKKSDIKVGTAKDVKNGSYKFFTSGEEVLRFNDYLVEGENIYLSTGGKAIVKYYNGKASYSTDTYSIKTKNSILTYYLYSILENIILDIDLLYFKGQSLKHLQKQEFKNIKIPLPPKEIQQKIVDEIGELEKNEEKNLEETKKYEEEIKNLVLNSGGEEKSIGSIEEELFAGGDLPQGNYIKGLKPTNEYKIPIYSNGLENDGLYGFTNIVKVKKECITISARGTIGYPIERKKPFYPIVRLLVFIPKKELAINKFLVYSIKNLDLKQFGATTPQLTVPQFRNFKIILPSLEKQKEIVEKIETLEEKIEKLEKENKNIPEKKKEILEKYL